MPTRRQPRSVEGCPSATADQDGSIAADRWLRPWPPGAAAHRLAPAAATAFAARRRWVLGLAGSGLGGLLGGCGGGAGGDGLVSGAGSATATASAESPTVQSQAAVREVSGLTPNNTGAAAANTAALQAALGSGRISLGITEPGVYCFATTIQLPSYCELQIGEGVVLVKLEDGYGATNLFTNSDHAGGNTDIRLYGRGTLYFGANAYASVYAANPVDCPLLPAFMNGIPGFRNYSSAMPYMNGLHFENVDRLVVDGLTLMMASKYNLYGAKLSNFLLQNLRIYSDDVVNPANAGTYGRDGIHVQGNTHKGTIRGISGCVNDDAIALNVRDIPEFTTVRSVGPITDVLVEDITVKNQRRSGCTVNLYGGRDTRRSPKDTAPAILSMTQSGRVVTVVCAGPHGMASGAAFDVQGSTAAGYDIAFGRVQSVPSANSFTFIAAAGLPAYAGGAQLTRYFQMTGITVRRVRGDCFGGPVVSLSVTTDVPNYGVLDGISIDDCSGVIRNPTGAGIVQSNYVRLVDLTVQRCFSQNGAMAPLFDSTQNGTRLVGTTRIEDCYTLVPYAPDPATGLAWMQLGNYESVVMTGGHATVEDAGGGWVQAISCGAPTGALKISGFKLEPSVAGGPVQLMRPLLSPQFGMLTVDNCWWPATGQICHIDGTSVDGTVVMTNNVAPAGAVVLLSHYGQNAAFSFQGNDFGQAAQGIVGAFQSSSVGTYVGSGNRMGNSPLFHRDSDLAATQASTVNSIDFQVDVTRIARVNGCIVTNTNAGAGSLGSAGPVVCVGNAPGSWHLLAGAGGGSY